MVDFGRAAQDYVRHRAGFPDRFFNDLENRGLLVSGATAVDLGTGTGTVACGLARRGMHVTAVDISEPLLEQARGVAQRSHLDVRFVRARAEETGLTGQAHRLVTAGQCWHWFERKAAAAEAHRLLAPGGGLVIAHLDWLSLPGGVVDVTVRAIEDFGARFADVLQAGRHGLYPDWTADVAEAGFCSIETRSFDVALPYSKGAWRGRVRASAPIGGTLSPEEVERFDRMLEGRLAPFADDLAVPHRVWWVSARKE